MGVKGKQAQLMVRHRFNVWIDVPAESGDGWHKYPDYSAAEIGRELRGALRSSMQYVVEVEHGETTDIKPGGG